MIHLNEASKTRDALLNRCQEAAFVWNTEKRPTELAPRREALIRAALEELVASGQVRMIRVGSLVVYIAWE